MPSSRGAEAVRLVVRVAEAGADAARLDHLRLTLRSELLLLDVDDVEQERNHGATPAGSRALDVAQVDTLVVAMTAAAPLVASVAQALGSWVRRAPRRSVEVVVGDNRLTLDAASAAQEDRLIELFASTLGRTD